MSVDYARFFKALCAQGCIDPAGPGGRCNGCNELARPSHDGCYFPSRLYALKVMMSPRTSKEASATMNKLVLAVADRRW